jgi:hypothetical protein
MLLALGREQRTGRRKDLPWPFNPDFDSAFQVHGSLQKKFPLPPEGRMSSDSSDRRQREIWRFQSDFPIRLGSVVKGNRRGEEFALH